MDVIAISWVGALTGLQDAALVGTITKKWQAHLLWKTDGEHPRWAPEFMKILALELTDRNAQTITKVSAYVYITIYSMCVCR